MSRAHNSRPDQQADPFGLDCYVSNAEAGAALGLRRMALQRLRSSGKLPFVLVGRQVRYRRSDVVALLDSNQNDNA